jgi:hypothetical protein
MPLDKNLALGRFGYMICGDIHACVPRAKLQTAQPPALLPLTKRIDEHGDEWVGEELPEVYALIGPVTIPVLAAGLADPTYGLWARVSIARALAKVGRHHPAARAECVAVLTQQLEQYAHQDSSLNAHLVSSLLDLRAIESAPGIKAAFAAKKVGLSVAGDWEEVQIELGLLATRLTPKPHFGFFNLFSDPPEPDAPAFAQSGSPEAPRKIQAQSHLQTKAKTRAKNKQTRKQQTQHRQKKKK